MRTCWQEVNIKGASVGNSCASVGKRLDHTMVLTGCSSMDCEHKNIGASVLFCTVVVQDQGLYHAFVFPYCSS